MTGITIVLSGKIRCCIQMPGDHDNFPHVGYYDSEESFLINCTDQIPGTKVSVQAKFPREVLNSVTPVVNAVEKLVGMITIVHGDKVDMWPVLESAATFTVVWES